VAQAAHGDDAIAMLRRQPYGVVLLDEQMPRPPRSRPDPGNPRDPIPRWPS
jgi:CheY-like chemotaxis protein